ncbi:MAG: hypothetical protein ACXIT9_01455 [Nitritalea sp.]
MKNNLRNSKFPKIAGVLALVLLFIQGFGLIAQTESGTCCPEEESRCYVLIGGETTPIDNTYFKKGSGPCMAI